MTLFAKKRQGRRLHDEDTNEHSTRELLHLLNGNHDVPKRSRISQFKGVNNKVREAISRSVHHVKKKSALVQLNQERSMALYLRHAHPQHRIAEGNLFERICLSGGKPFFRLGSIWLTLYHLVNVVLCCGDPFVWLPWVTSFVIFNDNASNGSVPGVVSLADVGLQVIQLGLLVTRFTVSIPNVLLGVEIFDTHVVFRSLMRSNNFRICVVSTVVTSTLMYFIEVSAVVSIFLCSLRVVRFFLTVFVQDATVLRDMIRSHYLRIGLLLIQILLVMHILACIWHYVGNFKRHEIWSPLKLYCEALNDATYMLSGTPPDQNSTRSVEHLLYTSLVATIGQLFFAYILAKFVDLVSQMSILQARYNEHMAMLHAAMQSLGLPPYLKRRIASYYAYRSVRYNSMAHEVLVCNLSLNLQAELKLFLCRDLLHHTALFLMFPKHIINKLIVALVDHVYAPGDIIVKEGDVGNEMYFVLQGSVEVYHKDTTTGTLTVYVVLEIGAYFGEVALVRKLLRTASIRSITFSILATLSRVDLDSILRIYPEYQGILSAHVAKSEVKQAMTNSEKMGAIYRRPKEVKTDAPLTENHDVEVVSKLSRHSLGPSSGAWKKPDIPTANTNMSRMWMESELIPMIVGELTRSASVIEESNADVFDERLHDYIMQDREC